MKPTVWVGLVILAVVLLATPTVAQDIYVDREATGPVHDGTSWCSAFTQLYEALTGAPPGATIRVADGLYLPDTSGLTDPREATFTIPAGLTIVGGYAGCGAVDPDDRDPFTYVTDLSGDLAGNDPGGGREDNAYHVVTATAMEAVTTLGGLVIRGGNSEGERIGGGILALGGRLVLSVCTLTENLAWRGGAIYIDTGELHLFQCRFTANLTSGEGGAIFDAMANLEAHNCLFALNLAGDDGGAIFCDLCNADFINCSFGGNESEGRGGGIYDYVGVSTYAGNCIFWGNQDMFGTGESSQIFINPSNILAIDYSCVQGWTSGFAGEGNIGDDPLLSDLSVGDLHLLPGSPSIDTGSNALVGTQLDLDGNPRIVNDTVDMGCFEFQGTTGLPPTGTSSGSPRIVSVDTEAGTPGGTVFFFPPHSGEWSLTIYDVAGRRLRVLGSGPGGTGPQQLLWNGQDTIGRGVPSGVYFFVLERGGQVLDSRKSVYLR